MAPKGLIELLSMCGQRKRGMGEPGVEGQGEGRGGELSGGWGE